MLKAIVKIINDMELLTGNFLEYDDPIPKLTIIFNGTQVDIPMDFAEFNSESECFMRNLLEIYEDYGFDE